MNFRVGAVMILTRVQKRGAFCGIFMQEAFCKKSSLEVLRNVEASDGLAG
jgi:hypothetical protein